MFPVREFFLLQEFKDGETMSCCRILVLVYSNNDLADTFRNHMHKGELKNMLTKTASYRRIIAILNEEDSIKVFYDSEFPDMIVD